MHALDMAALEHDLQVANLLDTCKPHMATEETALLMTFFAHDNHCHAKMDDSHDLGHSWRLFVVACYG